MYVGQKFNFFWLKHGRCTFCTKIENEYKLVHYLYFSPKISP